MRTTARRLLLALAISIGLFAVGLGGATVFHPDDGTLVQSETLWRIFGIGAYIAIFAFWLTVLVGLFVALRLIARAVARRG